MGKRLFTLLLALALVLTLVPAPVRAESGALIRCEDAAAAPGSTVCVSLRCEGLENLAALELELYYDPALLKFEYESMGGLLDGTIYDVHDDAQGRIALNAVSSQGISGSGVLLYLYFTVDADCPEGNYPLTLAVGEAYDTALVPVTIAADSGTVTVSKRQDTHGAFELDMALSADSVISGGELTVTVQNRHSAPFAGLDLVFSYDPAMFELMGAEASAELGGEAVCSVNTATAGLVRLTCASPRETWCRDLLTVRLRAREGVSGSGQFTAEAADVYDEALIPYQPGSARAEVEVKAEEVTVTPSLRLEAETMVIGEESSACLILGAGSSLAAADFRLEYDPELLECLAVEAAAGEGYLVINPNFKDGAIRFSYVLEAGAMEETPLITIRWRPKAGADRHYTIETTLIDPVDRDHNRVQIDCPAQSGCIYRQTVTEATCTEPGDTALVCVGCSSRIPGETTPALGHDYGEPVFSWSDDHAGCTAARVCARDSGHIWQVDCTVTESAEGGSCTEPGTVIYTATADFDGVLYTDEARVSKEALGHDYVWTVVTEPGCTSEGLRRGECARCGDALEEVLEPLGHAWEGTRCRRCGEVRENPFTDVPEDSFYYDPVIWAVSKGITNGTSATTFGPGDSCMRAHVVTFLWRAAGSPEPASSVNPFEDVKPTDFYYKAVLWAVENGITNGLDATHFGPFAYCNRAQVVTFLHRTLKSPKPTSANNPFTDVPAGQWFTDPVLWAVEHGITNGLSATTFGPTAVCNRAQIVTFLYRAFA